MKYLVNDIKKTGLFVNEFDNKEEAIKYAKYDFEQLGVYEDFNRGDKNDK